MSFEDLKPFLSPIIAQCNARNQKNILYKKTSITKIQLQFDSQGLDIEDQIIELFKKETNIKLIVERQGVICESRVKVKAQRKNETQGLVKTRKEFRDSTENLSSEEDPDPNFFPLMSPDKIQETLNTLNAYAESSCLEGQEGNKNLLQHGFG